MFLGPFGSNPFSFAINLLVCPSVTGADSDGAHKSALLKSKLYRDLVMSSEADCALEVSEDSTYMNNVSDVRPF
jgi:hypothetical protein